MATREELRALHSKRMELLKQGRGFFKVSESPTGSVYRTEIRMIGGMIRDCTFSSDLIRPLHVDWHYPYKSDVYLAVDGWKLMDDETREEAQE